MKQRQFLTGCGIIELIKIKIPNRVLQNALENEDITDEELEEMMGIIDFKLENKFDGCGYVIRNIGLTAKTLDEEVKRFAL